MGFGTDLKPRGKYSTLRLSWDLLNTSTIQNDQVQVKQPEVNSFRISYFSSVGSVNLKVN